MLEMLREFICDFSNVPPESITEETNIRTEVPMDSISLLNLAVAIENEFGIGIDKIIQVNFNSLMSIVDTLGGVEVNVPENNINEINKLSKTSLCSAVFAFTDRAQLLYS